MSNTTVEAHATPLSTIIACTSTEVAGNQAESVLSSPTTAPPNSSPPSSDGSASGEDTDVEVVIASNILTAIEAASIQALVTPHDDSPWVAGKKFYEVPPQPIRTTNVLSSKTWYTVYKGFWFGVVTSSNTANIATSGASGGSQKGFSSQQLAVNAFNEALNESAVAVVTK